MANSSCRLTLPLAFEYPDMFDPLNYFFAKYILPIVFLVGVTGNLLNTVVLLSKRMRSKTTLFLASMAIADILFFLCLFVIRFRVHDSLRHSFNYFVAWIHAQTPAVALASCFSGSSIWLTVAVTLERLIAVKFPFRAKTYLRQSRIVCAIITIYAVMLLSNIYLILCRRIKRYPICNNNGSNGENVTDLPKFTYRFDPVHRFPTYYKSSILMNVVIIVFVPLVLITVFNIMLVVVLFGRREVQQKLSHASLNARNEEDKVTRMVIIMICAYIIFNLPSGVTHILELAGAMVITKNSNGYILTQVSNMLVASGKTLNFIIYCSTSERFRRHLLIVLVQHWKSMTNRFPYLQYSVTVFGSASRRTTTESTAFADKVTKRLEVKQQSMPLISYPGFNPPHDGTAKKRYTIGSIPITSNPSCGRR